MWVVVILTSLIYCWFVVRSWRPLLPLVTTLLIAMLLSAPPLLSVLETYLGSRLSTKMPLTEFIDRSVSLASLWSLVSPIYDIDNGFIRRSGLVFSQGGWLIPVVSWALVSALSGKKDLLDRRLLVFGVIAGILIVCCLGSNTPFYSWTYRIPFWSSLRNPFKFLVLANAVVGICAALALERWCKKDADRSKLPTIYWLTLFVAIACGYAILNIRTPIGPLNAAVGLGAIAGVFLLPWMGQATLRLSFLTLHVLGAAGMLAMGQQAGLKTYREPYASYSRERLGITTDDRVLSAVPLQVDSRGRVAMQPFGLFHSATMNGYQSLTGTVLALAPIAFTNVLPAAVDGIVDRRYITRLIGSHFLRSLNVGYALAANSDANIQNKLIVSGFSPVQRGEESTLFRNPKVLSKAYFADEIYPYDAAAFFAGMIANQTSPRSAYIESALPQIGRNVDAKVKYQTWDNGDIDLELEVPSTAFLVISACYFPQWTAFADGKKLRVVRVNGTLMGVTVPAGTEHLQFRYRLILLPLALFSVLLGIAAGGWLHFRWRRFQYTGLTTDEPFALSSNQDMP
jgi:hypothetical protein